MVRQRRSAALPFDKQGAVRFGLVIARQLVGESAFDLVTTRDHGKLAPLAVPT